MLTALHNNSVAKHNADPEVIAQCANHTYGKVTAIGKNMQNISNKLSFSEVRVSRSRQ